MGMFENDADVDFGDEFTFDFNRTVLNKRPLESPQCETPKKQKIVQIPNNIVQRKFPGPAGILPDRKDSNSSITEDPKIETISCSQMSFNVFQSSPWVDMTSDYEFLTDCYNIKWIKNNARLSKLPNTKAPFLGAIIKSIECVESSNNIRTKVVLKDLSGDIKGTITKNLYEEYSDSLVPGSVIVLRQCGIITSCDNHYLTINPKNLVTIYWKNDTEMRIINVQEISCQDLKTVKIPQKENLSQLSVTGSQAELEVLKEAFEGVDMDSFLEDDDF